MLAAPRPTKRPHLNPRCVPSLRMVRLMGPGNAEKPIPQAKPATAAIKIGSLPHMLLPGLRFVVVFRLFAVVRFVLVLLVVVLVVIVLFDFPPPRPRDVR